MRNLLCENSLRGNIFWDLSTYQALEDIYGYILRFSVALLQPPYCNDFISMTLRHMFSFILLLYIYKQRFHLSWLRGILENISLPSNILSQRKRSISCKNFFLMATVRYIFRKDARTEPTNFPKACATANICLTLFTMEGTIRPSLPVFCL